MAYVVKMLYQTHQIGKVETLVRVLQEENWERKLKLAHANGISLKSRDQNGETILMRASRMNRLDVVKFLAEKCKVDVNQEDDVGQKAFHVTSNEEIQIYLLQHGTNVHEIMLCFAALENRLKVVGTLIGMGFNVNFRDPQGDTTLALCKSADDYRLKKMITLLKNNGATI